MPCSCRLLFEGVEILLLYSCMGCGAVRSEYAPCKCRDGRFRTVHPEGVHGKARWLREVRAEVTS